MKTLFLLSNFSQFVKYMTFPVLGQILGLVVVFFCTYIYSKNLPSLIENYSLFNNFNTLILFSILIALPGMIIFMKRIQACWKVSSNVGYCKNKALTDYQLKITAVKMLGDILPSISLCVVMRCCILLINILFRIFVLIFLSESCL